MKRFLLSLSYAVICQSPLFAQITIDSSSYTSVFAGTIDSASIAYGNLPALASGSNFNTNISSITYGIIDTAYLMHNAGPNGYLYADFIHHYISGATAYYFNSRPYYNINNNGFIQYGETIDGKAYSIAQVPGANGTDSLKFPAQTDVYTSPLTKIKFPATYNSNWSSSYTSDVQFIITYASVYLNAQGIYRSNITEYDTVVGWGTIKVKMADGTSSGPIDVLQVKVNYQQQDSFFVANAPANPALVSSFGLVQGNITTSYEYRYIRPNEVIPLVDVIFVNSNYSNTNVNKTVVHMQRLGAADTSTLVQNFEYKSDVQLYPNPLKGNTLFVNISSASDNISYQLINMIGQAVYHGKLAKNVGINTIQIPSGTIPGLYYLRLNDNDKEFYIKPLNIVK